MGKSYYKDGPIVDPEPVLLKVKQVVEAAEVLTEFEANFLKEVAHAADRFRATFRFSPKQATVLEALWTKHYLPKLIDAKTKKGTNEHSL